MTILLQISRIIRTFNNDVSLPAICYYYHWKLPYDSICDCKHFCKWKLPPTCSHQFKEKSPNRLQDSQ